MFGLYWTVRKDSEEAALKLRSESGGRALENIWGKENSKNKVTQVGKSMAFSRN